MKLRSFQLKLTYLDQSTERLEFTALTAERAVQSVVDKALAQDRPVRDVVTGDGRTFLIDNPEKNHEQS